MLKKICSGYCSTPLICRIGAAFVIGILAGMALSHAGTSMGQEWLHRVVAWISPFGTVLIAMLKMIVIPIIFLSLVCGASSLSVKKFGKLGSGVLLWYLFTSIAASVFGVFLATVMNPRMSNAAELSGRHLMQVGQLRSAGAGGAAQTFPGIRSSRGKMTGFGASASSIPRNRRRRRGENIVTAAGNGKAECSLSPSLSGRFITATHQVQCHFVPAHSGSPPERYSPGVSECTLRNTLQK